jgi:predicted ATPase
MISQVHIKNFKSIVDLTLELGRVNLFIGENGSGKSNILEAVAFATSTSNQKINDAIYLSKGGRISNSVLYGSAFKDKNEDIEIDVLVSNYLLKNIFKYNSENEWFNVSNSTHATNIVELFQHSVKYSASNDAVLVNKDEFGGYYLDIIFEKLKADTPIDIINRIKESWLQSKEYVKYFQHSELINYIIFSPEPSFLRKFEEEGQTKPLGSRGEGLFSLIKALANDNGGLQHIKEYMVAIDWFEDFSIPNDLMSNEYKISIKDRFINSDLKYLDQRSANEGFLFLLFYIVLFSSKKTPQFFAIDNIEASFNPKLCAKLINMLVDLSKKNEKQVLMTTHNPATLDGLDLNDPEQRLFVVRRNIDGHTIVTRISEKPKVTTPMKLSEMWTKGLLGGLPDNF